MIRLVTILLLATSMAVAQNAGRSGFAAPVIQTGAKSHALDATLFPGADIGAQINAAFASCGGKCKVEVPQGIYNYSTTIQLPVIILGGATLECDTMSTILNYTGSGDAMEAFGDNVPEAGLVVRNCSLEGGSATGNANGLHLKAFGNAVFENIRIIGFPGDGVLNEGANTITFNSPDIDSNTINIHNVGVVINGLGFSANAVKVFGGVLAYAKQWAVYEDPSQAGIAFPNGGNVYDGVVFENNGTSGQISGSVFFQGCDGCVISNSYLEFYRGEHVPYNIVVGDLSTGGIGGVDSGPQGVKIVNNHLLSVNATTSIDLLNGTMITVTGNDEVAQVTNFIDQSASVRSAFISNNVAIDATNYLTGAGAANDANAPSGVDASAPTLTGVGFNSLTGDQQDLQIRTRQGGTNNLIGLNSVGSAIYSIDNNGIGDFIGLKVENAGLTFDTPAAHINTIGGNSMISGTIVIADTASGSVSFPTPYNNPPSCQVTPLQDIKMMQPVTGLQANRAAVSRGMIARPAPSLPSMTVLNGEPRWWVSSSKAAVTVNLSVATNASFSYFCLGNPN